MPNARFIYEERVIAFIDILGMRQHLSNVTTERRVARNIAAVVHEVLKPTVELVARLPHLYDRSSVRATFSGWRGDANCQITSISDSLVISLPLSGAHPRFCTKSKIFSVYMCMEIVFWIQRELLQVGILTRGAISVGRIHHSTALVIGSGLATAYELETQVAIYPRVVLDEAVELLLLREPVPRAFLIKPRIGNLFRRDRDGIYFVDYLGLDLMATEKDWKKRLARIARFIDGQCVQVRDVRARQKLLWLREYVRSSEALLHIADDDRAHATVGRLESRFSRAVSSSIRGRQRRSQ